MAMSLSQCEIQLNKLQKERDAVIKTKRNLYSELDEHNHKLAQLKTSLDKAAYSFQDFDRLNQKFKNATNLRFVISWIESTANNTRSKSSKAYGCMDEAVNEQNREIRNIQQKCEQCEERIAVIEKQIYYYKKIRQELIIQQQQG